MTLHCLHMVNILKNACSLLFRHLIPDASNCFGMSQITGIPQGTIKAGLSVHTLNVIKIELKLLKLPKVPKMLIYLNMLAFLKS